MKKLLVLFLLLTSVSYSQFVPFGAWKSGAGAITPIAADSITLWADGNDFVDTLGRAEGDTTYVWPNRAKWYHAYNYGDLFQLTSTKKPTVIDSAFGIGAKFDNVDDWLGAADRLYSQPTTYIIVFRCYSPAGDDRLLEGSSPSAARHIIYMTTGRWTYVAAAQTGYSIDRSLAIDSTYLFTVQFNGSSSFIRVNGLQYANSDQSTINIDGITIGGSRSNNYFGGVIFSYFAFHSALPSDRIGHYESALAKKYGITLP